MKKLLLFVCLFSSLAMFGQKAMFQSNLTLKDGESKAMYEYYGSSFKIIGEQSSAIDENINNKYIEKALNNALLKSIGINDHKERLEFSVDYYGGGKYKLGPNKLHWFLCVGDFQTYCYTIIKSKKVRDVLFNLFANALCEYCRQYPKDYKTNVVKIIKRAKNYVLTMGNHKYEIRRDAYGWDRLFIDGKDAGEKAYEIEGFLIRRVIVDGFTTAELTGYLDKLLAMVLAVDVSANSDVLQSVNINNDLTYYLSYEGEYFVANKTRKKIPWKWESPRSSWLSPTVKCFGDKDGNLYRLYNEYYYIVIDNRGEILYEKK